MKSEERIKGYFDSRDVNINHHTYSQIQRLLGYEIKSEYYIVLPNESYHPLALLLALAKTKDITKKINTALSAIDTGQRGHLETVYFQINDKLTDFILPEQLSQCVDKFNYNINLFQKYSKRFEFILLNKLIEDNAGEYRIRKFEEKGQTTSLKTSRRLCKNQDILLIKQGEQMIIASFSDRQSAKKQILNKGQKQVVRQVKLRETSLIQGDQSEQSQIIEDNRSEQDEQGGETVLQKQDKLLFYFCLVILVLVLLVTVKVDFIEFLDAYLPDTHIFQTIVSVMSRLKK